MRASAFFSQLQEQIEDVKALTSSICSCNWLKKADALICSLHLIERVNNNVYATVYDGVYCKSLTRKMHGLQFVANALNVRNMCQFTRLNKACFYNGKRLVKSSIESITKSAFCFALSSKLCPERTNTRVAIPAF